MVGVNNSGKSTLLSSFRVLDIALKRARSRRPEPVYGPTGDAFGYPLAEDSLPISLENVHTDYVDSDTTITFRLSNANRLQLYFPNDGGCILIPLPAAKPIRTVDAFRSAYPADIVIVPVLGPVEHRELLVQQETMQRSLSTHLASRHFRNYWHYLPTDFEAFADLVKTTWPGMEVLRPERVDQGSPELSMYCLENRITRELYWAGFGFQIWCQLLTHIFRARSASLIVVDEPEVYLHPDVQRQLLALLRSIKADVLIATHSAEIIGEADPSEILIVDRTLKSARRLKDIEGVQDALDAIGSLQNLTLTRLARNRRILFTEGDQDLDVLRQFAAVAGYRQLASGAEITGVTSDGQSSKERIKALAWGLAKSMKTALVIGVVYDRDFLCEEEINKNIEELSGEVQLIRYLSRKEIENYLLIPSVLQRALEQAVLDKDRRAGTKTNDIENVANLLLSITDGTKAYLQAQYISNRVRYLSKSKKHPSVITQETIEWFESRWRFLETRLQIVCGKDVLSELRHQLQDKYGITLTDHKIIESFKLDELPSDLVELLKTLDAFRSMPLARR